MSNLTPEKVSSCLTIMERELSRELGRRDGQIGMLRDAIRRAIDAPGMISKRDILARAYLDSKDWVEPIRSVREPKENIK